MADVSEKIRFLEECRAHPEKYLPMADHAWKQYEDVDYGENWYDDPWYNRGWDAGLLEGNRPYFMIGWATCGITMATYYVSSEGIAEHGAQELLDMLEKAKLVKVSDRSRPRTDIMKWKDGSGKEFFSVNIAIGDENGTYARGGPMYSLAELNRFNRKREKEAERK